MSAPGTVRMNDQRSLYEQLLSVFQLANENGHYDAADWIMAQSIKPIQDRMAGQPTDGYKVKHG